MDQSKQRIESVARYTQNYLEKSFKKRKDKARLERFLLSDKYRWSHTLRVSQFGRMIAESEDVDLESVIVACLLHDIAWFDVNDENNREHGKIGSGLVRPLLDDLGYTHDRVENICYSIASHVTVKNPETLEAKIVSDADNIDRYGPYRILQWCFPDISDYEKLTGKLTERITRLEEYRKKNPLFTAIGKQLFTEQLQLQILFFSEFIGEKKLTTLPLI